MVQTTVSVILIMITQLETFASIKSFTGTFVLSTSRRNFIIVLFIFVNDNNINDILIATKHIVIPLGKWDPHYVNYVQITPKNTTVSAVQ